jgi:hypothetical protein
MGWVGPTKWTEPIQVGLSSVKKGWAEIGLANWTEPSQVGLRSVKKGWAEIGLANWTEIGPTYLTFVF